MKALLAVTLFLMLVCGLSGWFIVGGWKGALAGACVALGATVALVLLTYRGD